MPYSQNGWPALEQTSLLLYTWTIPARNGAVRIRLRNGSAGFVLAHFALWFAEKIQPLAGAVVDDWGWNYRPVRGQTSGLSNHASGTAEDLNATAHARGRIGTFNQVDADAIHKRLRRTYRNVVRWGEDYQHSPVDGMHFELVQSMRVVERLARLLMLTPRGRRILKANPGQAQVIRS